MFTQIGDKRQKWNELLFSRWIFTWKLYSRHDTHTHTKIKEIQKKSTALTCDARVPNYKTIWMQQTANKFTLINYWYDKNRKYIRRFGEVLIGLGNLWSVTICSLCMFVVNGVKCYCSTSLDANQWIKNKHSHAVEKGIDEGV